MLLLMVARLALSMKRSATASSKTSSSSHSQLLARWGPGVCTALPLHKQQL
jgi:hypothetical protein